MLAYKLLRVRRNGSLGPLFINCRQIIPIGKWLEAESHPRKGFAVRPGWHCCAVPKAPHLSPKGRMWCAVDIESFTDFRRPRRQGGLWYLAQRMKVIGILTGRSVGSRMDQAIAMELRDV